MGAGVVQAVGVVVCILLREFAWADAETFDGGALVTGFEVGAVDSGVGGDGDDCVSC